jgi:hypothetical protein
VIVDLKAGSHRGENVLADEAHGGCLHMADAVRW